jgi:hypothetical protein
MHISKWWVVYLSLELLTLKILCIIHSACSMCFFTMAKVLDSADPQTAEAETEYLCRILYYIYV